MWKYIVRAEWKVFFFENSILTLYTCPPVTSLPAQSGGSSALSVFWNVLGPAVEGCVYTKSLPPELLLSCTVTTLVYIIFIAYFFAHEYPKRRPFIAAWTFC
uniref:Uncharacterized protein n=1 Tax=Anguilla anguilla TaxID=7936 RepID=A0A0E9X622_ANGAN